MVLPELDLQVALDLAFCDLRQNLVVTRAYGNGPVSIGERQGHTFLRGIGVTLIGIELGGFKPFAEIQRIPIRPLTLIYGANSSGKSSLIHSILLINHALENGNLDVHQTKIGGESIDLGGFSQYVHRHEQKRVFEWGMQMHHKVVEEVVECLGGFEAAGVTFQVGLPEESGTSPTGSPAPVLLSFELALNGRKMLRLERRPNGRLHSVGLEFNHPVLTSAIKRLVEKEATRQADKQAGTLQGRSWYEFQDADFLNAERNEELQAAFQSAFKDEVARMMGDWNTITQDVDTDFSRVPFDTQHFFPRGQAPEGEEEDYAYIYRDYEPAYILDSLTGDRVPGDYGWIVRVLRFELEKLLDMYATAFSRRLRSVSYLGPLRCYPPRHLTGMHDQDPNWFSGGGHAWDVLRRSPELLVEVNRWLAAPSRLAKPYELVVRQLTDLRTITADLQPRLEECLAKLRADATVSVSGQAEAIIETLLSSRPTSAFSEIVLQDRSSKTEVSHRDIGQGISQVLPVLVNALASSNRVLAIEQPELHLHPALQAELGDVFIEAALGDRRNTLLLESHSEHLLLRLMRRMRETHRGTLPEGKRPVTPDDVAVLYVEPVGSRSIVREMPLNERGELVKDWPGGFFEEGLREVLM